MELAPSCLRRKPGRTWSASCLSQFFHSLGVCVCRSLWASPVIRANVAFSGRATTSNPDYVITGRPRRLALRLDVFQSQVSLSDMPDGVHDHSRAANGKHRAVWRPASQAERDLPQRQWKRLALWRHDATLGSLLQGSQRLDESLVSTLGLFSRPVLGPPARLPGSAAEPSL